MLLNLDGQRDAAIRALAALLHTRAVVADLDGRHPGTTLRLARHQLAAALDVLVEHELANWEAPARPANVRPIRREEVA